MIYVLVVCGSLAWQCAEPQVFESKSACEEMAADRNSAYSHWYDVERHFVCDERKKS